MSRQFELDQKALLAMMSADPPDGTGKDGEGPVSNGDAPISSAPPPVGQDLMAGHGGGETRELPLAGMSVDDVSTFLKSETDVDTYVGTVIADRYRILKPIGRGGMGTVYLAEHIVLEKRVAIKILSDDFAKRSELVQRFVQEARAASKIGHESIIDVTDFGRTPSGSVFFAMEFLDGKDLSTHVREDGPMPPKRVRHIGDQVCQALQAAHEKGITHRDMKPENVILIDRPGRKDIAKVLDFGIAKMNYIDGNADRLTRAGMVFGTPEYMAPEQASGDNPDHRVDIYSVGCILYELITGTAPFRAATVIAILSKQLFEQPEPPRQRAPNANIPVDMELVVLKSLEKDRSRRYQSMKELGEALAATGGPPEAAVPTMSPEAQARARRTSGWAILTGLLLDAGIALENCDYEVALNNAERVVQALGGTDVPELASHLPLLESIYTQALGDFSRIVNVANVPADLDPRAAFLISRIDGMSTIEDLIDVSGMPRLLALRLLVLLLRDTVLVAR